MMNNKKDKRWMNKKNNKIIKISYNNQFKIQQL